MENPALLHRTKLSENIRGIAERTEVLNPQYSDCMFDALDFLNWGELGLALDFFYQKLLNPDDWLIDVRLHDLLYVLRIQEEVGATHLYDLRDFGLSETHLDKLEQFGK